MSTAGKHGPESVAVVELLKASGPLTRAEIARAVTFRNGHQASNILYNLRTGGVLHRDEEGRYHLVRPDLVKRNGAAAPASAAPPSSSSGEASAPPPEQAGAPSSSRRRPSPTFAGDDVDVLALALEAARKQPRPVIRELERRALLLRRLADWPAMHAEVALALSELADDLEALAA